MPGPGQDVINLKVLEAFPELDGIRGAGQSRASNIGLDWYPLPTGRFTGNLDGRWVGADENFGPNDENWNENLGTGTAPVYRWNDFGPILPGGSIIHAVAFQFRANNAGTDDFELRINAVYPTDVTDFDEGWDAVGEETYDTIATYVQTANLPPAGAINDFRVEVLDTAYTIPATHVSASIQMAARLVDTANRQLFFSGALIVEPPNLLGWVDQFS